VAVNKTDFENLVKKSSAYDQFVTAGFSDAGTLIAKLADLTKQISDRDSQITSYQKDTLTLNATITSQAKQISDLSSLENDCAVKEKAAEKERDLYHGIITSCLTDLKLPTDDPKTLPTSLQALVATNIQLADENQTLGEEVVSLKAKLNNKCPSVIQQIINLLKGVK
jgi:ABC-type transporter Mla subunit MlaD